MPAHKVQPPQTEVRATTARGLLDPAIGFALILATFLVYGQVGRFDFIRFDDPAYVYLNPHVQAGLTWDSIKWSFTSVVAGNWAPLTLLSHLFVFQFFRLESGMHHLVNVAFHALAAVLLFATLVRATRERWPSAFVAGIFALHPLHVESVAWVSERKDVLSAFFWFLGLYTYVRYTERPIWRRYLLVGLALAFGLMSKTMLVTFPFTLLLFDIWPLRRTGLRKLVVEKLPLLALCAVASVASYIAQQSGGAISEVALSLRVKNALTSYAVYIGQMFWPSKLAWFYVYPDSIAAAQVAAAVTLLAAVSVLAIWTWRSRPYLATGWFWYLGTLVPVIGLVQIGAQAHADRYMYIPMTGLSIMLAWGAVDLARRWPAAKWAVAGAGGLACCACMALASTQTSYWQDGATLFQHGLDVGHNNYWTRYTLALEHYSLGNDLMNSGRRGEAIAHFEKVLEVKPDWAEAHNNLAILLAAVPGHSAEVIAHFEAAVHLNPDLAQAQRNLGMLLASDPARVGEAIGHLEAAHRLQPDAEILRTLDKLRRQRKQ